jgi:hypothetical protein
MYAIKINGSFIDLFPDTTITLEVPNTLFMGAEIDRYLQPHSLPVDVPATTGNQAIIGPAHVVQVRGVLYRSIPCELWLYGSLWRRGTAMIQVATRRRYRLAMVFNPYERLKELTRGHRVDGERMREFVRGLGLSAAAQARLLELTPAGYTGVAADLAREFGPAASGR